MIIDDQNPREDNDMNDVTSEDGGGLSSPNTVIIGDQEVQPELASPGGTETQESLPPQMESTTTLVGDQEEVTRSGPQTRHLGATLSRVTVGGALIGLDVITERLEQVEAAESESIQESRNLESVLVPMSEWAINFGEPADRTARYLMLGMMVDAKNKGQRGSRVLRRLSDFAFDIAGTVFRPIMTSKATSPVQGWFNKAVRRGETQVQEWIELGRQTDLRSRSSAELAFNQTAEEAMDEIIDNERIQVFIQDVVQAQSVGIVDEAIEEIRERTISADKFIEAPFRSILHRPRRESVAGPNFEPRRVRPYNKRNLPIKEGSLLGYYAGFVSRLMAFALDVLFLTIILALGGWLLTTSINLLGLDAFITPFSRFRESTNSLSSVLFGLNGLIILLAYFVILWVLTGQTLGMMIIGLRVVTYTGDQLKFWQALFRLAGMFIGSILLFLGYFWVIIDDHRQGWHDKLAKSYVVHAWDARPDESFLMEYFVRDG